MVMYLIEGTGGPCALSVRLFIVTFMLQREPFLVFALQ